MATATRKAPMAVGIAAPPASVPRLLAGVRAHHGRMTLSDHLHWYGDPFVPGLDAQGRLTELVARSGLTGRGGAGFPTARKLESVARKRSRSVVVINAMEGEPASAKDRYLLSVAPHLVLDGAAIAASAVGADAITVAIRRDRPEPIHSLDRALDERRRYKLDRVDPSVHAGPPRYVGGEEAALVHWLNGGEIKPTAVPPRPFERGVNNKPTLILNAETAAHLALITRYGSTWFRQVGTKDAPGTALMTISGVVSAPGVAEVAIGQPLATIIRACNPQSEPEMLLAGGYFGGWIPWALADQLTTDPGQLRAAGAGLGAGILVAAPAGTCVMAETARIVSYLARESAGQCGPCFNGVAAIAADLGLLCSTQASPDVTRRLRRRLAVIDGRGACALPDGVRRLVLSALDGFPDHLELHERHGACRHAVRLALPLPAAPVGEAAWR